MASKKNSIGNFLSIGGMTASLVFKNFPFVLFLSFLTVVYIANAHFAEKQIRQIQTLQSEVKDLKRQYNSLKSENMLKSQLAEIEEDVERIGLTKKSGSVKRIIAD